MRAREHSPRPTTDHRRGPRPSGLAKTSLIVSAAKARLIVASEPSPADAIVVLGCTLRPLGIPGRAMEERLVTAADLYAEGNAPLILAAGGRTWHGVKEAQAMAGFLRRSGVPDSALLIEPHSLSTKDNARLGAELLRDRHARHLLLVTQPLHLRRAVRAFESHGFETRGVLIHGSYQLQPRLTTTVLREVAREAGALARDAFLESIQGYRLGL